MGYQEGFLRVGGLAEAAGVRMAVRVMNNALGDIGVSFLAVARAKTSVSAGETRGVMAMLMTKGAARKDELLVCLGGERGPVHALTDFDVDPILFGGGRHLQYSDVFEDLPDSVLDGVADMNPEDALAAAMRTARRYMEYRDGLTPGINATYTFDSLEDMIEAIATARD